MVVNMTKAKRYEGEAQRGYIWHSQMRDRVYALIKEHDPALKAIFHDYDKCGYILRCDWWRTCRTMSKW
jgi:hypothetical protein